jgi:uncharacterized protein
MSKLPPWLRRLDAALESLGDSADPMLLSQLDGYLAGVLVCPELIMPAEWLPPVWTRDGETEPVFDNEEQLRTTVDLVMKLYNSISRDLGRGDGRYAPLYDVHAETGEVICVFWLLGFTRAMSLRPECWLEIAQGDNEDAATALSILMVLASAGDTETDLPDEELEELLTQAPDMIPHCVQHLNDWRLRNEGRPIQPTQKVGRNNPCPCGSGKKYKKCCGSN